MAEIVLENITKRYPDGALAVDKMNLDIADGEFMILVGPSGCGKSTTLNMIAGLEDISDGELRIGGKVVNNKAPKDRDIAMVFQSYALYPHMTVRQNMAFALKLAKTPKEEIDQKVEEAAAILDLTEHLDHRPANLSGGQRQRVALGRAIVRHPQAFLMDEPLSNLDAKLRVQTRTSISRLQKRLGTTMVYVTHDQTEAMTLGDRLAVMRAGLLQQAGTPQELFMTGRSTLFVAGFIRSLLAMNSSWAPRWRRARCGPASATCRCPRSCARCWNRPTWAARSSWACAPRTSRTPRIVPAENQQFGFKFRQTIDVRGVHGLKRTCSSTSTWTATCRPTFRPISPTWPRTRAPLTPLAPTSRSRPGWTRRPRSGRARTRSCGWTCGRCTCSTRSPQPEPGPGGARRRRGAADAGLTVMPRVRGLGPGGGSGPGGPDGPRRGGVARAAAAAALAGRWPLFWLDGG